MRYRSRTDIVAQILEAANGGATKTKIMYKAYLSYAQLREYLTVLQENELLEYVEGDNTYRTTTKGLKFINVCYQIDNRQTDRFANSTSRGIANYRLSREMKYGDAYLNCQTVISKPLPAKRLVQSI